MSQEYMTDNDTRNPRRWNLSEHLKSYTETRRKEERLLIQRCSELQALVWELEALGDFVTDLIVTIHQPVIYVKGGEHELAAVFRVLRRHKFVTYERPEPNATYYNGIFYASPYDPNSWEVHTGGSLLISFASTVCHRVKIGTKTIEVDVYETHCKEPSNV